MTKTSFQAASFQAMAARLETAIDGNPGADAQAHLLVHALSVAEGHDLRVVWAYAQGDSYNGYARDIMPMLLMQGQGAEDILRGHLREVFARGVGDLCRRMTGSRYAACAQLEHAMKGFVRGKAGRYVEPADAGLMRTLGFARRAPGIVIEAPRTRSEDAAVTILAV